VPSAWWVIFFLLDFAINMRECRQARTLFTVGMDTQTALFYLGRLAAVGLVQLHLFWRRRRIWGGGS